jgi:hypothetical protein
MRATPADSARSFLGRVPPFDFLKRYFAAHQIVADLRNGPFCGFGVVEPTLVDRLVVGPMTPVGMAKEPSAACCTIGSTSASMSETASQRQRTLQPESGWSVH